MITKIRLENFRGFGVHTVPFGPLTVVVGQNNAGKTTIVEALRFISMVVLRYRNLGFRDPPPDTDLPRRFTGVAPSLKNVEIGFDTIFHQYQEPPASIEATFASGASVTIYILSKRRIHAVITGPDGKIIRNRHQANQVTLPPVSIMPQVAPLQRSEVILAQDYVKAAMTSRLAPLHYRNQLNVRYDLFQKFRQLVEETWPGVKVHELIGQGGLPGVQLHLEIRNRGFVAEVAAMGEGLQMWLQTMWFLTISQESTTVILDEPDVYMHADLQRRIIRLLRNRHPQTILTTHSVEIMSEVQPEEILVVDRRRRESSFAGSLPAVQAAIDHWGSVHNIHLARLLNARKLILVEGKDLKLLKVFQDTMFPDSSSPFQGLPNMSIGGWSGWKLALGSSMAFKNALGESIRSYCILDSDYHVSQEIAQRYREAQEKRVDLHIWERKEVENYLLSPQVIARVIAGRVATRTKPPEAPEIGEKLSAIADELEDDTLDAIATEERRNNRSLGTTGANRAARLRIRQERDQHQSILRLVSGKSVLSLLSDWSSKEFRVSFGPVSVARQMTAREIPHEVATVVTAIENGEAFPKPTATC